MKKLVLLFVMVMLGKISPGQSTFLSTYDTIPNPANMFGSGHYTYFMLRVGPTSYMAVARKTQHANITYYKFNDAGDILWWKRTPYAGIARNMALLTDSTVAYLIQPTNTSDENIIVKVDLNGNPVRTTTLSNPFGSSVAITIEADNNGGYFLASGEKIIRINASGNIVFQKSFSSSSGHPIAIYELMHDGNNSVTCVGQVTVSATSRNMAIFKCDGSGNVTNYKEISMTPTINGQLSFGQSIITKSPDGAHYCTLNIVDTTYRTTSLLKFDTQNQPVWSKSIVTPNNGLSLSNVEATADSGCRMFFVTNFNLGQALPAILKFSKDGNLEWTKMIGDTAIIGWRAMNLTSIQPAPNNHWMITIGRSVTFNIFKLDSAFGGACYYMPYTPIISDIIPTPVAYTVTSSNVALDIDTLSPIMTEIISYRFALCTGLSAEETRGEMANDEISIAPNPSSGQVQISFKTPQLQFQPGDEITLYDVMGKIAFVQRITEASPALIIRTSTFSNGIYLLHLKTKETTLCAKVLVQH